MTTPNVPRNVAGAHFRSSELASAFYLIGNLYARGDVPVPVGALSPIVEFSVASEADVEKVASLLHKTATRFKDTCFVELDRGELRARWSAQIADPVRFSIETNVASPAPSVVCAPARPRLTVTPIGAEA